MALPEHQLDMSEDPGYLVMGRVPGSYLGCASGIFAQQAFLAREVGTADGVLFAMPTRNYEAELGVTFAKITDGLSKTMLVGEAVHDIAAQDSLGSSRPETSRLGNRKDHWYIGGDAGDMGRDYSEALGSTGVPINLQNNYRDTVPCAGVTSNECDALQLSFGSTHPGGMQFVRCDGSVDFVNESVEMPIWQGLGTRASQEFEIE